MKKAENVIKTAKRHKKMLKLYGDIKADQEWRGFIERVPEI